MLSEFMKSINKTTNPTSIINPQILPYIFADISNQTNTHISMHKLNQAISLIIYKTIKNKNPEKPRNQESL